MRFMNSSLPGTSRVLLFAVTCWMVGAVATGQEMIEQTIEFRSGMVIRATTPNIEIPWQIVSDDGSVTDASRRLSDFQELHFARETLTKKAQRVRRLIDSLASRDYHERLAAEHRLVIEGETFRGMLEAARAKATDLELQWRLDQVMRRLPNSSSVSRANYDLALVAGDKKEFGDAQNLVLKATWRGHELSLSREEVRSIKFEAPTFETSAEPAVVEAKRLTWSAKGGPLEGARWIKFETGPDGEPLQVGRSISNTFAPWGCLLSTSISDSIVSVEKYNVGGPSGGMCAANHEPIYEGIMTIRFCQPGNPQAAAGVRKMGFWASHVSPDGTILRAFDERGRLLAEIPTTESSRQFLGIESNVPIARVEVTPKPEIDPDFAIDDLMYEDPTPLAESGDPDRYTVVTRGGERLHCESLASQGGELIMQNLLPGVDSVPLKNDEVAVLAPPHAKAVVPEMPGGFFLRLNDGSIIASRYEDGVKPFLLSDLAIQKDDITSLWGQTESVRTPAAKEWKEGGVVARIGGDTLFTDWSFGAQWIEAKELSELTQATYADSPTVWFRPAQARPETAGLLRLVSGDELVLSPDAFEIVSWADDSVAVRRGEKEWSLAMKDIRSLLLPTAEPSEE